MSLTCNYSFLSASFFLSSSSSFFLFSFISGQCSFSDRGVVGFLRSTSSV